MKRSRGMDFSRVLVLAALLVTTVRYAGAFAASDAGTVDGWLSQAISIGMAVSGVGMGLLDVLGMAYVFDGWRRALPRSGTKWSARFRVLSGFVAGLFLSGLGILTPFTVSRVAGVEMGMLLGGGWLWLWAGLVNLAPYLVIGGVVVGGTISPVGNAPQEWRPNPPAPFPEKEGGGATVVAMEKVTHRCAQCGAGFANQQGLAAHIRWKHAVHEVHAAHGLHAEHGGLDGKE